MLISLLFASQIMIFGFCSEQNMGSSCFSKNKDILAKVITVPLKQYGHEIYIDIDIGNPKQPMKAKLDFQTHYSLFVDRNSDFFSDKSIFFAKEAAFKGSNYTISDAGFNTKLITTLEKKQNSKVFGCYGDSIVSIGNKVVKKHFLDVTYKYPKFPLFLPQFKEFYISSNDSKDPKSVNVGYLDFQEYESGGITNGFLGLEPRFKDTPSNGFFSNETSIMDFLGPEQMITIDMRNGKSLFSLGNAINNNENINWVYSVKNNTFEIIIDFVSIGRKSVGINTKNTTAIFNPRYRDIYIEKKTADQINYLSFQPTSKCKMDSRNVVFHAESQTISLKPESFLKSGTYSCKSNIKPIKDGYPKEKWIFGWSFNIGRAIVYDYKLSRIGFVDN
ncbi:hypothetical protein BB559_005337 [Furculomyces boomerangus]|uniref:Peptidase A1 domain-containing protein n=2 Tax=Harpellales TaxID=61421 RepID=A0A2T9Y979_9FUNG|nr:hypothetical protein BB559_005681 [Furculomyces boomerangus]PVU88882.1 hypothetical protein BB559_005337 [Furculomyces boomerangus]PWA02993.1 hypothetical protein BB558_000860 [Smittium angustum]